MSLDLDYRALANKHRHIGRTTAMLHSAIDASEYEKSIFVVAHNHDYALQLKRIMEELLTVRRIIFESVSKDTIRLKVGTEYTFITMAGHKRRLLGSHPKVFYDHYKIHLRWRNDAE